MPDLTLAEYREWRKRTNERRRLLRESPVTPWMEYVFVWEDVSPYDVAYAMAMCSECHWKNYRLGDGTPDPERSDSDA